MSWNFRRMPWGRPPPAPPNSCLSLVSAAARRSSPAASVAAASASDAHSSGAIFRTVLNPCAAAAVVSSSCDILTASALTCELELPPPPTPASPPPARSASIICANKYVARDWQHAVLIASAASARFSSSSPASINDRKWYARSSWKMLKYDAAAGPSARTSSAWPCCHACWIAIVMRRQFGCASASAKSTARHRSELSRRWSHCGRPFTASTLLVSNFFLMSCSRKCISSCRTRVRQSFSACAVAFAAASFASDGRFPADPWFARSPPSPSRENGVRGFVVAPPCGV
mmetsp:Transcript_13177/g.47318  ORF Transcript_13177/g.47318 Transcript_13177/m.47318 type:complete len:288 (-) Transcript_13177:477-1340(-)